MRLNRTLLLSGWLVAMAGTALAQAPPTPATPPPPTAPPSANQNRATNCAPTQTGEQGRLTPKDSTTTGQSAEPLGDKLARSDGVLCPPANVDPQMRAPTPDAGNTPVIPPPGSPGGDPTIRPK